MKIFYLAFAVALISTSALSQSAVEVFNFQLELKEHNYLPDTPDGKIGKNTRKAMSDYAKKYGIPATFKDITLNMRKLNLASRVEITEASQIESIKQGVSFELKDPQSIQIRNLYKIKGVPNLVCGEVNGKNSYGAYAGFVPFTGGIIPDDTFILYSDLSKISSEVAWFVCKHRHT